jgi:hypothetical protein
MQNNSQDNNKSGTLPNEQEFKDLFPNNFRKPKTFVLSSLPSILPMPITNLLNKSNIAILKQLNLTKQQNEQPKKPPTNTKPPQTIKALSATTNNLTKHIPPSKPLPNIPISTYNYIGDFDRFLNDQSANKTPETTSELNCAATFGPLINPDPSSQTNEQIDPNKPSPVSKETNKENITVGPSPVTEKTEKETLEKLFSKIIKICSVCKNYLLKLWKLAKPHLTYLPKWFFNHGLPKESTSISIKMPTKSSLPGKPPTSSQCYNSNTDNTTNSHNVLAKTITPT